MFGRLLRFSNLPRVSRLLFVNKSSKYNHPIYPYSYLTSAIWPFLLHITVIKYLTRAPFIVIQASPRLRIRLGGWVGPPTAQMTLVSALLGKSCFSSHQSKYMVVHRLANSAIIKIKRTFSLDWGRVPGKYQAKNGKSRELIVSLLLVSIARAGG